MAKKPYAPEIKIERPNLIIYEGKEDGAFFEHFLKNLGLIDDFQRYNADGVNNIARFIKFIRNAKGAEKLKSIVVIADSDNKPKGRSQSIKDALRRANFPVPTSPCVVAMSKNSDNVQKTAYALFPKLNSDDENGALENLYLELLTHPRQNEILSIVDSAMTNYEKQIEVLNHPHKNRLHTYLSLTNEYVAEGLSAVMSKNAFDFNSEKLQPLKDLLSSIVGDEL
ncbi:MAG: hypothetical protein FWG87_12800 [Defluviitaleaceae bacterium]|nr:hypothetical protein [Defluviitaleaceae bacterium]